VHYIKVSCHLQTLVDLSPGKKSTVPVREEADWGSRAVLDTLVETEIWTQGFQAVTSNIMREGCNLSYVNELCTNFGLRYVGLEWSGLAQWYSAELRAEW
jgi:hypothetical protein